MKELNNITEPDLLIVHSPGQEPEIKIVEEIMADRDRVYIIPRGEKYTISKTDEQKDAYIDRLETQLAELRAKIYSIESILFPEEDEDVE